jgi:hypothetical protein
MSTRVAICVTLAVLIAMLALCPVPIGHGPFSTVYGPATAFRAYRAALQLQFAFAAILLLVLPFRTRAALFSLRSFRSANDCPPLEVESEDFSLLGVASLLRC